MRKLYIVVLIVLAIIFTSCASKNDSNIYKYRIIDNKETVYINYTCDFTHIAKKNDSDSCSKPNNENYVSIITSYNYQNKPFFQLYMMQMYSLKNKYTRYYKDYTKGEQNFHTIHFNEMPITSFVAQEDNFTAISISKRDIIPRAVIYPTLEIKKIYTKKSMVNNIEDINIIYRIPPNEYEIQRISQNISTYFGLPLNSSDLEKNILDAYNKKLELFWSDPIKYKNDYGDLANYALPMVGEYREEYNKLKGDMDDINIESNLITSYLPGYRLIEIIIVNESGKELKTFGIEDIYGMIVSPDINNALYFITNSNQKIGISYKYLAITPKKIETDDKQLQDAIKSIYKTIARNITVNIKAVKPYPLKDINLNCFSNENISSIEKGENKKLKNFIQSLNMDTNYKCTEIELLIANNIENYFI